jgi:cytochrome oxidase Cu insertion factor (SCO1/SenC/PrrC family)
MITVDPRRDTVKALANYVRDFHPKLIGMTGKIANVKPYTVFQNLISFLNRFKVLLVKLKKYPNCIVCMRALG